MINCVFLDYREIRENIISPEPKVQNCSSLYGPLHWWKDWALKQEDFQNSLKIQLSLKASVER